MCKEDSLTQATLLEIKENLQQIKLELCELNRNAEDIRDDAKIFAKLDHLDEMFHHTDIIINRVENIKNNGVR